MQELDAAPRAIAPEKLVAFAPLCQELIPYSFLWSKPRWEFAGKAPFRLEWRMSGHRSQVTALRKSCEPQNTSLKCSPLLHHIPLLSLWDSTARSFPIKISICVLKHVGPWWPSWSCLQHVAVLPGEGFIWNSLFSNGPTDFGPSLHEHGPVTTWSLFLNGKTSI